MPEYHSFSEQAVQAALNAARDHCHSSNHMEAGNNQRLVEVDNGQLSFFAHSISLTISNSEICLNLPLGIGKIVLPVANSNNGKIAKACISVCTAGGEQTGLKITVDADGVTII